MGLKGHRERHVARTCLLWYLTRGLPSAAQSKSNINIGEVRQGRYTASHHGCVHAHMSWGCSVLTTAVCRGPAYGPSDGCRCRKTAMAAASTAEATSCGRRASGARQPVGWYVTTAK